MSKKLRELSERRNRIRLLLQVGSVRIDYKYIEGSQGTINRGRFSKLRSSVGGLFGQRSKATAEGSIQGLEGNRYTKKQNI